MSAARRFIHSEADSNARAETRRSRFGQTMLAALAAWLAGCVTGPDYAPPATGLPDSFVEAGDPVFLTEQPQDAWWMALDDERLADLIAQALRTNHDLRIADANVQAARALARGVGLERLPVVTAAASVTRQRGSLAQQIPGARSQTFYEAGFDAAWEIDVFGRVRRGIAAAGADVETAMAERHDVAVIVAAEVARSYLELRGARLRLDVARRNAANQQQTFALTESLAARGRGSELDVARARAQLETTLASIEPLETIVATSKHRLAVLTGRRSDELLLDLSLPAGLPALPDRVAIGDPAHLLRRRADVRAAERRLAAATARVGVATADLFPKVSLIGSAGFLSASADAFADSGTGRATLGPFLSWPAFDLGRVRARLAVADANATALLAAYEQSVLVALEEADNGLVGYVRTGARQSRLAVAADASERAVELARKRYRAGMDSFLNVLDAERRMLEAQDQLAQASTSHALAFVALYKAMGGGWQLLPVVAAQ